MFRLALLLAPLLAFGADVTCPPSMDTRQQASSPPAEWTVSRDDGASHLAGITIYDGPPSEQASLVYDNRTSGKGTWAAVWTFPAGPPRPYFLACSYEGTKLILSRQLPAATKECRVVYKSHETVAGLPAIVSVACR